MTATSQTPVRPANPQQFAGGGGPEVIFAQKKIWLGGVIENQSEADEIVLTINALKPMLVKEDGDTSADVLEGGDE